MSRYIYACFLCAALTGCVGSQHTIPANVTLDVQSYDDNRLNRYCVVVQPEQVVYGDLRPVQTNLKCGMSLEDATALRNAQATLLGVK